MVNVIYSCGICREEYDSIDDATGCERIHKKPERFFRKPFQLIDDVVFGGIVSKPNGTPCQCGGYDRSYENLHKSDCRNKRHIVDQSEGEIEIEAVKW